MNTPFVTLAEIDTLDRKVLLKGCFKGPGTIGQIFPKPLSSGYKKLFWYKKNVYYSFRTSEEEYIRAK